MTQRFTKSNHWMLHIQSLRTSREQHVPDSSDHSQYLIKLLYSSSPEGNCGECAARQHTLANTRAPTHKTRQDKTRQDKTRQDKTRQDKTRQDKTRQDKTRQDETRRDETRRDETRRDETRRDETRERRREKREERETYSNTLTNAFLYWENSSSTPSPSMIHITLLPDVSLCSLLPATQKQINT